VAFKKIKLNGNFLKKNENISKEYSLSRKIVTFQVAKFCTKRHADWHTQINPSCYLMLSFKVFPQVLQLELERIKTFKLQKTSPQKLAKGSNRVGAKSY
jgi:hypothetical protein